MKKRLLALMLTLAICVTFMPTVFFQSVEEVNALEYESDVTFDAGEHGEFAEMPYYGDPTLDEHYVIQNNKKMAHTFMESAAEDFYYEVMGLPSMSDGIYSFLKEYAYAWEGFGAHITPNDSIQRTWDELMSDLFPTLEGWLPNVVVIPDKGWVFDGWYDAASGGNKVNFATEFTGDKTFYAHYIQEDAAPAHKGSDWKYITADTSYMMLGTLLETIAEQGRTYSDKEWKTFCNMNSVIDTAYALCGDCGLEERVRLSTPDVEWDGNQHVAGIEYSDGWKKRNSVQGLDLYYFDVSAFEKYYDEVWTAMKYMGISEQEIEYGWDGYETTFEAFSEMLETYNEEFGIDTPTRVAPSDPGRYIAMLVPDNYKKQMSFSMDGFSFPIYAASLFTIKSTDDSCKHEWEYSGLSGTAGPFLADYVKKYMHGRMNGTIEGRLVPSGPESEKMEYVKEILKELVSAILGHAQDEDFDETFTYDSYEDLTAPLNDLFSKITAKCSDCGKKQYIEVKGADEDAEIKNVQIDDSHWTATGLKDEYVTYYVSVDKLVEAISPFFSEELPITDPTTDDFMYEIAKAVYKALSGVLGSARTTAPVKAGKYVAFTTFKGEYGEPLDLSKLSDTILNGMRMIIDDPTDTDPVTMRKYYKAMKTVDSALEDLLDVAVTFYAVRPETVLEPGKTFDEHIMPAVTYANTKVKSTLTKYDAAYVENAREKINEAKELASKMKLTADQKETLKNADNRVATAEKKLKVMNSRTSITKLTAGKRKITVKWNKLGNDVAGYRFYRSTSKYGKYKLLKTTTLTSRTNKSLKKGKKYYYKVRGFAKIGGQMVYTNYSTPKAARAK